LGLFVDTTKSSGAPAVIESPVSVVAMDELVNITSSVFGIVPRSGEFSGLGIVMHHGVDFALICHESHISRSSLRPEVHSGGQRSFSPLVLEGELDTVAVVRNQLPKPELVVLELEFQFLKVSAISFINVDIVPLGVIPVLVVRFLIISGFNSEFSKSLTLVNQLEVRTEGDFLREHSNALVDDALAPGIGLSDGEVVLSIGESVLISNFTISIEVVGFVQVGS
jgi:hypothetical protein